VCADLSQVCATKRQKSQVNECVKTAHSLASSVFHGPVVFDYHFPHRDLRYGRECSVRGSRKECVAVVHPYSRRSKQVFLPIKKLMLCVHAPSRLGGRAILVPMVLKGTPKIYLCLRAHMPGHRQIDASPRRPSYSEEPRCINNTRTLTTATSAISNHTHCQMVCECFAAQLLEESSFRFASSAEPAATNLLFQRSMRLVETPSSWLTVSTDSPLSKRSTASVFS
jgi:hypothetical protein